MSDYNRLVEKIKEKAEQARVREYLDALGGRDSSTYSVSRRVLLSLLVDVGESTYDIPSGYEGLDGLSVAELHSLAGYVRLG